MRRAWGFPMLLLAAASFAAKQQAPDLSVADAPTISAIPALPTPLPLVQAESPTIPASLFPAPSIAPGAAASPIPSAAEIATLSAQSARLQAMPDHERAGAIDALIHDLDIKIRPRLKPGEFLHGTSLEDLKKIIADGFMREGFPDDGYPPGVWAHQVVEKDREATYLQALLYAQGRAKHITRSTPVLLRIKSTKTSPLEFTGRPWAMRLERGQARLENLELFVPSRSAWEPLKPGRSEPSVTSPDSPIIPAPPPQQPASGFKRALRKVHNALNGAPGTRQRVFKQSAAIGLAIGAVAPVLWKAAPLETLILSLPAAIGIGLAVILAGTLVASLAARS